MNYKKIPKNYFPTILDRLTRFEPANRRYKRVFDDIINKFSLSQKLKNLDIVDEIALVEEIFNSSLSKVNSNNAFSDIIKKREEEFFVKNEQSELFLNSKIDIAQMALEAGFDKYDLFPYISKIILCEGETERILFKTLVELFDIDFDKSGFKLIARGGKNQVARKYYSMVDYTKLPFFILLDKDASSVREMINKKLRKIDYIYMIESGEFEDIIPINILCDAINYAHKNDIHCSVDDFSDESSNVDAIHNIYKKYGFGEYKKARLAQVLDEYIKLNLTKNDFSNSEIVKIAKKLND